MNINRIISDYQTSAITDCRCQHPKGCHIRVRKVDGCCLKHGGQRAFLAMKAKQNKPFSTTLGDALRQHEAA